MLNLHQLQNVVKSDAAAGAMDRVVLNTNNLVALNVAYNQLVDLGWKCGDGDGVNMETHPADNVPLWRLGQAALHRHPGRNGWLLQINGQPEEFVTGTIDEITERAIHLDRLMNGRGRRAGHTYDIAPGDGGISDQDLEAPLLAEYERMLAQAEAQRQAEPEFAPLSPAAEVGVELKRQFPHLVARIDRAVALVEQGVTEFPHYNTRLDEATGVSACDCLDHAPYVSSDNRIGILTLFNGKGCKHCLARNIAYQIEHERESAAYRRLIDKLDRERAHSERSHAAAKQVNERRPAPAIGSMPLAWQAR